ncbi:MAG: hypothetical protein BGO31_16355 [Bacteroidetes bacterium 43-16]|nr:MAG: hypothetical protein BGO31_16355 [Bacteroidetes bacterium 43-16]
MKLVFKIFLSFVLGQLAVTSAFAQPKKMTYRSRLADSVRLINTQEVEPRVKGPKPLTREHAFGARINTDGWGLYFNYGLIKKNEGRKSEIDRFYNVLYFQVEVGERYHPKEFRDFSNVGAQPYRNYFLSIFSTDMFKFGKINNFYTGKLGVGYRYLLAGKPEASTIAIHWNTNAGLALALLKPYYFKSTSNADMKLDPNDENLVNVLAYTQFTGGYGYRKGWDELKVTPGGYLRTGLKFDYANRKKRVAGFELGLGAEMYFTGINQMALQDAKSVFVNAFVSFELGWKK